MCIFRSLTLALSVLKTFHFLSNNSMNFQEQMIFRHCTKMRKCQTKHTVRLLYTLLKDHTKVHLDLCFIDLYLECIKEQGIAIATSGLLTSTPRLFRLHIKKKTHTQQKIVNLFKNSKRPILSFANFYISEKLRRNDRMIY